MSIKIDKKVGDAEGKTNVTYSVGAKGSSYIVYLPLLFKGLYIQYKYNKKEDALTIFSVPQGSGRGLRKVASSISLKGESKLRVYVPSKAIKLRRTPKSKIVMKGLSYSVGEHFIVIQGIAALANEELKGEVQRTLEEALVDSTHAELEWSRGGLVDPNPVPRERMAMDIKSAVSFVNYYVGEGDRYQLRVQDNKLAVYEVQAQKIC